MNRQIGWSTESNLLWQIGNQIDRMTGVIGSTLSTFVPQSRTLTINGVTYDLSANRSWTVATGLSGTIATGQVAFASATNTISGTNNLFWDAANSRLGIGTNTPVSSVDVLINNSSPSYDSINLKNTNANGKTSTNLLNNNNEGGSFGTYGTTFGAISFRNNFAVGATKSVIFLTDGNLATGGTSPILFIIGGYDNTPQMTLNGSGRLLLGTTTDGGQRLQVQGDAFIKGSGATSATIALTVQNSSSNSLLTLSNAGEFQLFGANNLLIQPTDTNPTSVVYSGRNTVFYNYTTNQAATIGSFIFNGANFTHQSANSIVFNILKGIAPTGGTGTFSLFSISSTINQTGGANGITRGLYVNPTLTAAADWRSIETSTGKVLFNKDNGATTQADYTLNLKGNNPRLRLEAGTGGTTNADAVIQFADSAGDNWIIKRDNSTLALILGYGWNNSLQQVLTLGIRSSDPTAIVRAAASSTTDVFLAKNFSGTDLFSIRNNGNILVNTGTDAGFKLDVNGTARVSDNLSVTKNQNAETALIITNTNNTSLALSALRLKSAGNAELQVLKFSLSTTPYKIAAAGDGVIYNNSITGDLSILNDVNSGNIKFSAGGSSTAQMTLTAAGRLLLGTTTESTFLLDVNGTARILGQTTTQLSSNAGNNPNLLVETTNGESARLQVKNSEGSFSLQTNDNTHNITNSNTAISFQDTIPGVRIASGSGGAGSEGNMLLISGTKNSFNNNSRGIFINTILAAAQNNTNLIGLDINPTFTPGAFSNISSIGLRVQIGGAIIGGTSLNASAQLQVDSTTQGFLPPRMTNGQRTAISSPAVGLIVYCTDATEGLYVYKSTGWTFVI